MDCYICNSRIKNSSKYCSSKCKHIARLRKMATKRLLDAEEKTFGEGYDSKVKRMWITMQLEEVGNGTQDERMYKMFLARNDKY